MEFTKQNAEATIQAVGDMWAALTRPKKMEFAAQLDDIMHFLEAAKKAAPEKQS